MTFTCNDCGRVRHTDEARMLRGGGAVCEECSDFYRSCDVCDWYFPIYDANQTTCPDCSK